jgi:hypothetical protein
MLVVSSFHHDEVHTYVRGTSKLASIPCYLLPVDLHGLYRVQRCAECYMNPFQRFSSLHGTIECFIFYHVMNAIQVALLKTFCNTS